MRALAKSFLDKNKPLDILVNNAGLVARENCKTSEGFEIHFAIAQGHFLLSVLLLPALKKATSARIVTVSSALYEHAPDIPYEKVKGDMVLESQSYRQSISSYCVSKLANVYYSRWLGLQLKQENLPILTCSVHPGRPL